ncbi:MAG: ABC transporter permease [Nitrospiria bacterium]
MLRTYWAFLRRDAAIWVSYPWARFLDVLSIFFSCATFYFLSQLLGSTALPALESYGGNYFAFVLIGIAFSNFQGVGLNSIARSLRTEQQIGTLETTLSTPVTLPRFVVGSILWDFLYATIETFLYFGIGILVFGFSMKESHLLSAMLVLMASVFAFSSLGVLSAAFILRFKRGDPIAWFLGTVSELLGGVFFPLIILPAWLQEISWFIPMAHALEGLRLSLLQGAGIGQVFHHFLWLLIFSAVLLPFSFLLLHWAFRQSQKEGSLGHY